VVEPLEQPDEAGQTAEAPLRVALWPELFKTLMMALIIFLTARLFVLPYQVDGRSMAPNLEDRDRVLVNRAVYMHLDLETLLGWIPGVDTTDTAYYPFHSPEQGDIVVLNPPDVSPEPYIKRTIAVAGDIVDIRGGLVFVNGTQVVEPYVDGAITECERPTYCDDYVVPDGTIYVLGDNRQHSYDSRAFGPVSLANVIGKAWFANWPADRIGLLPHYDYDEATPKR
jgi:signal peptidase I